MQLTNIVFWSVETVWVRLSVVVRMAEFACWAHRPSIRRMVIPRGIHLRVETQSDALGPVPLGHRLRNVSDARIHRAIMTVAIRMGVIN